MYRFVVEVGQIDGQAVYVRDDYLVAPYESQVRALAALAELELKAPHLAAGLRLAKVVGHGQSGRYYSHGAQAEHWQIVC